MTALLLRVQMVCIYRYYSRGSIFAGGGALCIARVICGFKIRGPYSPAVFRERTLFPCYVRPGFFFRGRKNVLRKVIHLKVNEKRN